MSRWLRAGAIALAVLALAASALQVSREGSGRLPAAPGTAPDPLAAELERCNAIGPASGRDPACERVWAENRRRFLGAHGQTPDPAVADVARPTTPGEQP